MGLTWERNNRRNVLEKQINRAVTEAIIDAEGDYDDVDAQLLRDWFGNLDLPELPEGGKQRE